MASQPTGPRPLGLDVSIDISGDEDVPLDEDEIRELVELALSGNAEPATVSLTFLPVDQMADLNTRTFGHENPTDVIAFPLNHAGTVAGDIYVCPAMAVVRARELGLSVREEVARYIVHGMLHVLGLDHPPGDDRTDSDMWRRQESILGEWKEGHR